MKQIWFVMNARNYVQHELFEAYDTESAAEARVVDLNERDGDEEDPEPWFFGLYKIQ